MLPRGFGRGLNRRQGFRRQRLRLALGAAVGPGQAGQYLPHPLVIGGIRVAGRPVDLRQGGLLQAEEGHRQALLRQLRQEGGGQLRRGRQGRQGGDPPGFGLVLQPHIHRSGTSSQWLELDSAL